MSAVGVGEVCLADRPGSKVKRRYVKQNMEYWKMKKVVILSAVESKTHKDRNCLFATLE